MKKFVIGAMAVACCSFLFAGCHKKKKKTVVVEAPSVKVDGNTVSINELEISLKEILNRLNALESSSCCEDLTTEVSSIESRIALLESNVGCITREGTDIILEGVNLVVRDGSGEDECVPGVGNILVGRDRFSDFAEFYGVDPIRTGSNCVVIGGGNQYTGKGGLLVGLFNSLESDGSVLFSCENKSTGDFSTVTGGTNNHTSGKFSSISGGCDHTVSLYCGWCAGVFCGANDED